MPVTAVYTISAHHVATAAVSTKNPAVPSPSSGRSGTMGIVRQVEAKRGQHPSTDSTPLQAAARSVRISHRGEVSPAPIF